MRIQNQNVNLTLSIQSRLSLLMLCDLIEICDLSLHAYTGLLVGLNPVVLFELLSNEVSPLPLATELTFCSSA